MDAYLRDIPKAELHMHLEGSLEPELMFELARRNGVDTGFATVEEVRAAYSFSNLQDFLDIYYQGANVLRTEADFRDLAAAYFERAAAERAAEQLRGEGFEVNVTGVPAYSTLGWFSDPLLNTFIGGTEGQLAALVFHELAHQVVFVGGDTTFNESFATAVEREGVRRWLAAHGDESTRSGYAEFAQRRGQFIALLLQYRGQLDDLYRGGAPIEEKRARKRQLFAALKAEYVELRASWGGYAGYDRYFAQDLGNARLAAVGAYNDLVPAFDGLLAPSGGDLSRFYAEVARLAAMPREQRESELRGVRVSR